MKKLGFLAIALVLVMAVVFSGCTQTAPVTDNSGNTQAADSSEPKETPKAETVKGLSGKIAVEGSTSVTPLAETLAEAFMDANKDVTIEITGNGSGAGIKATDEQATDIGMASRNLKASELETGIEIHQIAWDAIAVCVNPSNEVVGLNKEQIKEIFMGEITNWNELGGNDEEIHVISREAGSGTRGAFEEMLDLEDKVRTDAQVCDGNGAVKGSVANMANAIGYISLGYVDDTVKALKVDGAKATVANVMSGSYGIKRPFNMLTKGETSEAAEAYLGFIMSEAGQAIVAENYVPMVGKVEMPAYSGKIAVEGSTSVTPLMETISEAFMGKNPNVSVEITGNGSGAGIKAAQEKTTDIGMASRELKDTETGITPIVIAWDAIAISVHPSNPVNELTSEQVQKIFSGEISNWSEVGGSNEEIHVISREAGSGTRGAFEELLDLEDKVKTDAQVCDGNGAVKGSVANMTNAIGYISLGFVDSTVKALVIDGVEASTENVLNGTYGLKRPFNLLTNGEISDIAQALIDFALSSAGQEIVSTNYVTVQ